MPKDENCEHKVEGWTFACKGWKETNATKLKRDSTQHSNLHPTSRRAVLDADTLINLELTCNCSVERDTLWFFQLALLMCDVLKSSAEDDP